MGKANSAGTVLKIGDVTVGGLTSIGGIELSAESIDVTDLSNQTGYREKLPGFKDGGDVSLSGFLDGADEGQEKCLELMHSGEVEGCSIIFPEKIGKTWSFQAGVTKLSTNSSVGDAVKFDATLSVSGKPELVKSST